MYIGAFDSAYYNSTDATGNLYLCGNTGGFPLSMRFDISAGVPGLPPAVPPGHTGSTAACSPITDIANPNTQAARRAHFVSVQNKAVLLSALPPPVA